MPDKASISSSPRILLDPLNLEIADALNAGTTFAPPDKVTLEIAWSPEQRHAIHSQIMSWLKKDTQTEVIELLRREPTAIAHPSVFWQLIHLSGLLRQIDEDDVKAFDEQGASYDDTQSVLPSGVKTTAEEFLSKLISAWVSAILPGHTVRPPKHFKRRGRTAKWATEDRITILTEFGSLHEALLKIEATEVVLPKKNEPKAKFMKRMETLVQRLNTRTLEYWFASIKTSATITKRAVIKKQPPSLPNVVASKIVRQAVSGKGKRLSKNKLLYGILAHHYLMDCGDIGTMRGLIEHAEADFPELDSRDRRFRLSKS